MFISEYQLMFVQYLGCWLKWQSGIRYSLAFLKNCLTRPLTIEVQTAMLFSSFIHTYLDVIHLLMCSSRTPQLSSIIETPFIFFLTRGPFVQYYYRCKCFIHVHWLTASQSLFRNKDKIRFFFVFFKFFFSFVFVLRET